MTEYFILPQQLSQAISQVKKAHPFLSDRLVFDDLDPEQLNTLAQRIAEQGYSFSSLDLYFEWHQKPVVAVRLSAIDWLVHFALLQHLPDIRSSGDTLMTAYQIPDIPGLLQACREWKARHQPKWVLRTDIQGFFSGIRHQQLFIDIAKLGIVKPAIQLIQSFLSAMDTAAWQLAKDQAQAYTYHAKQGLAVGAELSFFLSQVYLQELDQALRDLSFPFFGLRYLDDMLFFAQNENELDQIQTLLSEQLAHRGLHLHLDKTKRQRSDQPIRFLGEIL